MKTRTILFALAATMMLFAACDKDNRNNTDNTEDPNWVDLGLPSGLLWAKCNVGATTPEGFGGYYSWGETTTKEEYIWTTYQYCMSNQFDLTKYCNDPNHGYNGFTDNLTTLEPSDDAATVNLGNGARTPTKEEWDELLNNTTVEWTTFNDIHGCSFTATNGNSIFVPAAGYIYSTEVDGEDGYGGYWTSSMNTDYPTDAWAFYLYFSRHEVQPYYRFRGHSIRAVKQK